MKQVGRLIKWIDDHPVRAALYLLASIIGVFLLVLIIVMIVRPAEFLPWVGVSHLDKTENVKTLWDWLDLLFVSAVVALGLYFLNTSQKTRESKRQEDDRQQATLQNYYDKMSKLILEERLGERCRIPG